jgi:hypothetical protein
MTDPITLATQQLGRMRGMNRAYHEQFFSDIRFASAAIVTLFVIGAWQVPVAFLLIPPVAILGAVQTAFDASYLIFSRHYSTVLEDRLNEAAGANVLVANEMENVYLFPLDQRKIVTFAPGSSFTWFGFMTLFYAGLGVAAFGFGLALGWDTLQSAGDAWPAVYLTVTASLLLSALAVGWWWFVGGVGERRLAAIADTVSLQGGDRA